MKDFKMSKDFTFFEFTDSKQFPELVKQNRLELLTNPEYFRDAILLFERILQPLRFSFGPIKITSGFRFQALNKAVGGAKNSQHMRGQAADITLPSLIQVDWIDEEILEIWKEDWLAGYRWHQVIIYRKENFMHISLPTGKHDQQVILK